jgi:hypothetical protein
METIQLQSFRQWQPIRHKNIDRSRNSKPNSEPNAWAPPLKVIVVVVVVAVTVAVMEVAVAVKDPVAAEVPVGDEDLGAKADAEAMVQQIAPRTKNSI